MKKYRALFFDLDHTLWDFDRNSEETIAGLFDIHHLKNRGVPEFGDFIRFYRKVNHEMWDAYHRHEISKATLRSGRFLRTLEHFGLPDDALAEKMAEEYLIECPKKTHLFPGTLETLNHLKEEKYPLHIITNGFKEVQYIKIRQSGLEPFFNAIHISEEIGFKKPEVEIFHYAAARASAHPSECLMIGDNPDTDIAGAINAGIDPVLFDPHGVHSNLSTWPVIQRLSHLPELL